MLLKYVTVSSTRHSILLPQKFFNQLLYVVYPVPGVTLPYKAGTFFEPDTKLCSKFIKKQ